MHAIVGGVVISIGVAWIAAWAMYALFVKFGISSLGSGGYRPAKSPEEGAALIARGEASYRHAATVLKRGVPLAGIVIVLGIVIASV